MSSVAIETFLKLVLSHGYMNTISSELLLPHPVGGQASLGNQVKRECCRSAACCNDAEMVIKKMNSMTSSVEKSSEDTSRDDSSVVR